MTPPPGSYDELQFTLGEGPCLDAVALRSPIMIADLADPTDEARWPAYAEAMLAHGIRGVYAVPITVAGQYVGALDVFHAQPPAWTIDQVIGVAEAADLAPIPILDLLAEELRQQATTPGSHAWTELNTLTRAEVSQATGILMVQLGIGAPAALAQLRGYRLRGQAYATSRTATVVARDILAHHLYLERD